MKYTPSFNSLLKEGFLYSLKSPAFAKHQWSTLKSGPLARCESSERGRKPGIQGELVVHFGEWTTSSGRKDEKRPKTRESRVASGPLWRVDHWLGVKVRKMAENQGIKGSQWSTPPSGPLARCERAENGQK